MIYNEKFIWLHFPKCAGTKVEYLFEKYFSDVSNIIQDPVGPDKDPTIAWHDSCAERKSRNPDFDIGSKIIICPFRKLPQWLESRYLYEVQRNPHLPHNAELLLEGKFYESSGYLNHADFYAKKYLPKSLLKRGNIKFLRTEYFEMDFKSIFSAFIDLSKIPDYEFAEKVNSSEGQLPEPIKNSLNNSTEKIYRNCPYWCNIEKMAY
jgi:hypothetical protein